MSTLVRASKRFNPQAIAGETLLSTFIGRQEALSYVMAQLGAHGASRSLQHFVVTGPRGIGKTALLRMIRLGVEADPSLSPRWACVTFPEEDYRIYGLRSFFCRIVEELARDGHVSADLAHDATACGDWESVAELLERAATQAHRRVVLLLDNIDLVLEELITDTDEHQALKRYLETTQTLLVVAASARLVEDLADYHRPLFGHFAEIQLAPFTDAEVEAFFKALAAHDDWQPLLQDYARFAPRIKAITTLTDGNPRLLLILYDLLRSRDLPSASAYLEAILDDITPLYQDVLRRVPGKERRVLDEVLRAERASTPKDVAVALGWSQQEVGVLLQRLSERRLLRRRPSGRRTYYESSGGLLRLYYEMRHVHPTARRIPMLVDFLEAWHSRAELRGLLERQREAYASASERGGSVARATLDAVMYVAEALAAKRRSGVPEYLEEIRRLVDAGRTDEAAEQLREVETARRRRRETSASAVARTQLYVDIAQERWRAGRLEDARRSLISCLAYASANMWTGAVAHTLFAVLSMKAGDRDAGDRAARHAEEDLDRILAYATGAGRDAQERLDSKRCRAGLASTLAFLSTPCQLERITRAIAAWADLVAQPESTAALHWEAATSRLDLLERAVGVDVRHATFASNAFLAVTSDLLSVSDRLDAADMAGRGTARAMATALSALSLVDQAGAPSARHAMARVGHEFGDRSGPLPHWTALLAFGDGEQFTDAGRTESSGEGSVIAERLLSAAELLKDDPLDHDLALRAATSAAYAFEDEGRHAHARIAWTIARRIIASSGELAWLKPVEEQVLVNDHSSAFATFVSCLPAEVRTGELGRRVFVLAYLLALACTGASELALDCLDAVGRDLLRGTELLRPFRLVIERRRATDGDAFLATLQPEDRRALESIEESWRVAACNALPGVVGATAVVHERDAG